MPASSGAAGNGTSVSRPPTTYFSVWQRLFRGYGPVAVLAALIVIVALTVPSKVPKTSNAASVGTGANGVVNNSNGTGTGTGSGTGSGSGSGTGTGSGSGTSSAGKSGSGSSGLTASGGSGGSGSGGSAGSAGQAGTAGRTVDVPGVTKACGGPAVQVPGDPYSPPCISFSGNNGGSTARGVTSNSIIVSVRLTADQS